ncbi:MAG: cation transporter [Chlamydiales bacterium]|nr:cation transporter [Chlamydiia bacterium]MCP5508099.1 cation transporter [Chlamydiales bacterium]
MSKFPDPVKPKEDVDRERRLRAHDIRKSIKLGIAIRLGIVIAELFGVAFFGSAALFMDALASAIDIGSSLLLVLFIKLAERPPDDDHPFGHGRYEPLAGLQLGLFLAFIGASMIFQQVYELGTNAERQPLESGVWIIPTVAVILLEISYQVVKKTAQRQHSPALAADAIHYRIDALTSLLAAIALILAQWQPHFSVIIDQLGAMAISCLMIGLGLHASRNNLHQLLDRVPERKFFERVQRAAAAVSGVLDTEKIRIQQYGPDAHVDIDIEVDPNLPVDQAHRISQKVRANIQEMWPQVRDVTVHIEPYYPGDH